MNSTQIECFLEAAKALSFTAAAETLYISQPTLSRNISALEKELGLNLFVRRNNVLTLTSGGELMAKELLGIKARLYQSVDRAIAMQSARRLRLGFIESEFPTETLTKNIQSLKRHDPDTSFEIIHDSAIGLTRRLKDDTLDAAIMLEQGLVLDSELEYANFEKVRMNLAMPVFREPESQLVSLKAYSGESFVSVRKERSQNMTANIIRDCQRAGFMPQIVEADNVDEMISLMEAGMGVSIIPANHRACNNPLLCLAHAKEVPDAQMSCVWNRRSVSRVTKEFVDIITA